jgi:hypothetical protein
LTRSIRKLFLRKIGNKKLDEPELKSLDGFKVVLFLWLSLWLTQIYTLDLFLASIDSFQWKFKQAKLPFVLVVSSQVAIDLFHMLSAFFVTHSINKIARDHEKGLGFANLL